MSKAPPGLQFQDDKIAQLRQMFLELEAKHVRCEKYNVYPVPIEILTAPFERPGSNWTNSRRDEAKALRSVLYPSNARLCYASNEHSNSFKRGTTATLKKRRWDSELNNSRMAESAQPIRTFYNIT